MNDDDRDGSIIVGVATAHELAFLFIVGVATAHELAFPFISC